jgi:hypothetical protein
MKQAIDKIDKLLEEPNRFQKEINSSSPQRKEKLLRLSERGVL